MEKQVEKTRGKKLASNILLYALTMILPKVFSFLLVPVYTACLTTDEYGISDLIINTSALILPIFSLSINNAVLLFTMENKSDVRPYQIGIRHWYVSSGILMVCLIAAGAVFRIETPYLFFIFLIYSATILSEVLLAYIKSQEKMRLIGIATVGGSFLAIISNILTIVVFHLGAYGFLISTVVGYIFQIAVFYLDIRKAHLFRKKTSDGKREICRDMYRYSTPLIFSSLSWWIYSASDRYFITGMISRSENGIYSVAYKIPNMLQMVEAVFSRAWFFSIFDLYKTDEGRHYIEKIYDLYHFLMCFCGALLIAADIILAKILYSNEFYTAWRYVPPLLISIIFTALSSFLSSFLMVYRRSDITAKVSVATAIINSILNYVLIRYTGTAMGAAVATAVTAALNWAISLFNAFRLGKIKVPMVKHSMIFIILIVESIIIIKSQNVFICMALALIVLLMNIKNCREVLDKGLSYIKNIKWKI